MAEQADRGPMKKIGIVGLRGCDVEDVKRKCKGLAVELIFRGADDQEIVPDWDYAILCIKFISHRWQRAVYKALPRERVHPHCGGHTGLVERIKRIASGGGKVPYRLKDKPDNPVTNLQGEAQMQPKTVNHNGRLSIKPDGTQSPDWVKMLGEALKNLGEFLHRRADEENEHLRDEMSLWKNQIEQEGTQNVQELLAFEEKFENMNAELTADHEKLKRALDHVSEQINTDLRAVQTCTGKLEALADQLRTDLTDVRTRLPDIHSELLGRIGDASTSLNDRVEQLAEDLRKELEQFATRTTERGQASDRDISALKGQVGELQIELRQARALANDERTARLLLDDEVKGLAEKVKVIREEQARTLWNRVSSWWRWR